MSDLEHVWIVEMLNPLNNTWEPTIGCGLTKDDARQELNKWATNNPDDRFRPVRYVRAKIG